MKRKDNACDDFSQVLTAAAAILLVSMIVGIFGRWANAEEVKPNSKMQQARQEISLEWAQE